MGTERLPIQKAFCAGVGSVRFLLELGLEMADDLRRLFSVEWNIADK